MENTKNDLICPICGAPTRVYMGNARKDRLCATHANELKAGKITKCEDCGTWHSTDTNCTCKNLVYTELPREGFSKCLICNEKTIGYAFCRDCYYDYSNETLLEILNNPNNINAIIEKAKTTNKVLSSNEDIEHKSKCIVCGEKTIKNSIHCAKCNAEIQNYKDSIDKNAFQSDLLDYYYNLKFNIYRMINIETIKSYCNKLFSIATLLNDLYDNSSLIDRVQKDIQELIEKKTPKEKTILITEKTEKNDSIRANLKQTVDGHMVKSDPETVIDDILYNNRIVHAYEKVVTFNNESKRKKCDWFIPVLSDRQGIYIEYWGMTTEQYIINKKEKIDLYKTNDLPLIEIQKDDYKDKNTLIDYLITTINKLALEYFNTQKFIK